MRPGEVTAVIQTISDAVKGFGPIRAWGTGNGEAEARKAAGGLTDYTY